jgi:hypothetical protein
VCLIVGCQLSFYSTSPLGWCERICGVCVVSCVATGGREREGKQANKAELSVVDGARRLLPLCRLKTSDAAITGCFLRDVCCPFAAWTRVMRLLPVAFCCSAGAHESYGSEQGSLTINGPCSAIVISCFFGCCRWRAHPSFGCCCCITRTPLCRLFSNISKLKFMIIDV